jgi:hypothetical protein
MTHPTSPDSPPTTAPRAAERPVLFLFAAATLMLAGVGAYRAFKDYPDWLHWREETDSFLRLGYAPPNTAMYGYLPGAFFLLMPFASGRLVPVKVGAVLFELSNVAAIMAAVWSAGRWWIDRGGRWSGLAGLVAGLMGLYLLDPVYGNQLTLWVLAGVTAGLALVRGGREFLGGAFIGAACVVKPLPGLLLVFLGWKRHWRAVAGALLAGAALNLLPTVLFMGWPAPPRGDDTDELSPAVRGVVRTWREHLAWMDRAAKHSTHWLIEQPLYYRRNVSPPAVMARWLRAIPPGAEWYVEVRDPAVTFDADGRPVLSPQGQWTMDRLVEQHGGPDKVVAFAAPGQPEGQGQTQGGLPHTTVIDIGRLPRPAVADLSADTVRTLHKVFQAVVLAGLLAVSWGRGRDDDRVRWYAQASLWVLGMLWLGPYMTHNYYAWTYPVAVLLAWLASPESPRPRMVIARRFALVALAVWGLIQFTRASMDLQFYGSHLAGLFVLGAALLPFAVAAAPPGAGGAVPSDAAGADD